jgi:hypothetical protein
MTIRFPKVSSRRSSTVLNFPTASALCSRRAASATVSFTWYNQEHRHSGIAMLTPEMVHARRADARTPNRQWWLSFDCCDRSGLWVNLDDQLLRCPGTRIAYFIALCSRIPLHRLKGPGHVCRYRCRGLLHCICRSQSLTYEPDNIDSKTKKEDAGNTQ